MTITDRVCQHYAKQAEVPVDHIKLIHRPRIYPQHHLLFRIIPRVYDVVLETDGHKDQHLGRIVIGWQVDKNHQECWLVGENGTLSSRPLDLWHIG